MSFGKFSCIAAAIQISWATVVSEGDRNCAALPTEKSAGEHVMLQHSTQQAAAPARVNLETLSNHDEKRFPSEQVMLQHPAPATVNLKTLSLHDAKHYPESLQDRPSALLHTEGPASPQLPRRPEYKFEPSFFPAPSDSEKRSSAVDFNTPALLASVLNVSDSRTKIVANRSSAAKKSRAKHNSSQAPVEYNFQWVGFGQCIYNTVPQCGICQNQAGEQCKVQKGTDCFTNLGWTTCGSEIIGGCPGLTACQDFCKETEECGAINYYKGHCWMFAIVKDAQGAPRPYVAGNHMVQWYHCWAKTLGPAQLGEAVPTTTSTTTTGWAGAWFVGEAGMSCHQVCADAGGCREPMLYELDTQLEVQEVATRLDTKCDEFQESGKPKPLSPAYRYEEMMASQETFEGRMCYWRPDFQNPGNRNCDASEDDFIRICPCEDASVVD